MKNTIRIFILSVFLTAGFFSCIKSSPPSDCDMGGYGTITVYNTTSASYDLYIDDKYQETISANSTVVKIHIKEGKHHKVYVKEINGTADHVTYIDVDHCNDYNWQIS